LDPKYNRSENVGTALASRNRALEFVSVNVFYPLIQEAAPLESILERYQTQYQQAYLEMMQNKLGLFSLKEDASLFRC
jgi:uncharacterized protein YdiU (UPF0061 family)